MYIMDWVIADVSLLKLYISTLAYLMELIQLMHALLHSNFVDPIKIPNPMCI